MTIIFFIMISIIATAIIVIIIVIIIIITIVIVIFIAVTIVITIIIIIMIIVGRWHRLEVRARVKDWKRAEKALGNAIVATWGFGPGPDSGACLGSIVLCLQQAAMAFEDTRQRSNFFNLLG